MTRDEVLRLDRAHVWHPYTPMGAYRTSDPLVIERASGVFLHDKDGRRYFDANSSWWVAALGHSHPRLVRALTEQAQTLAHCALAGIAHEPASKLAAELCRLTEGAHSHVFFTDNGSTALEAAMKMAVQYWAQSGAPAKTRFVALNGAFHGDTIGVAALGGVEVFRRPFAGILLDCFHAPTPEESSYAQTFEAIAHELKHHGSSIAAVVVEPVVQGANGMWMYPPALLSALRAVCDRYDVLLVIDEVFAGYGRTGQMWASEHAGIWGDLMCIGKTLGSMLPLGAVLASPRVERAFLGDASRAFYYGHTFCGHPLATSVALEVLSVFRDEALVQRAQQMEAAMRPRFASLAELRDVERVRVLGAIAALDLRDDASGYLAKGGWRVYEEARKRGAYLRPLGNTVYVCPPLVSTDDELAAMLDIVEESVRASIAPAKR